MSALLVYDDGRARLAEAVRWLGAAAVVLGVHGFVAAELVRSRAVAVPMEAPMVIELAPLPVAPPTSAVDTPAPEMTEAPEPTEPEVPPDPLARIEDAPLPLPEPEPLPEAAQSPAPDIEVPLPPPMPLSAELTRQETAVEPPRQPPQAKPKRKEASRRPPSPSTSAAASPRADASPRLAAQMAGASSARSMTPASWRSLLVAHLNRYKRYPSEARARGEQGRPRVAFTIDRSGRVISARLASGSGSSSLDAEAVAMLRRASPLPPPPPDVGGRSISFTVPVLFNLR